MCRVRQIEKEIKYAFELLGCFCGQATHPSSFSLECLFFFFPLTKIILSSEYFTWGFNCCDGKKIKDAVGTIS